MSLSSSGDSVLNKDYADNIRQLDQGVYVFTQRGNDSYPHRTVRQCLESHDVHICNPYQKDGIGYNGKYCDQCGCLFWHSNGLPFTEMALKWKPLGRDPSKCECKWMCQFPDDKALLTTNTKYCKECGGLNRASWGSSNLSVATPVFSWDHIDGLRGHKLSCQYDITMARRLIRSKIKEMERDDIHIVKEKIKYARHRKKVSAFLKRQGNRARLLAFETLMKRDEILNRLAKEKLQ